jgi:hypothetical protein
VGLLAELPEYYLIVVGRPHHPSSNEKRPRASANTSPPSPQTSSLVQRGKKGQKNFTAFFCHGAASRGGAST